MTFDLQEANMEVFKGKNLKNFGFERAPNQICVKISVELAWSLNQLTYHLSASSAWVLRLAWEVLFFFKSQF